MIKYICATMLAFASLNASCIECDQIKSNIKEYEDWLNQFKPDSGLDIEQYYYVLGKRDASTIILFIHTISAHHELVDHDNQDQQE